MIEKANENRRRPIAFHTDGSEAPLWLSVSPKKLRVHLLTLDGHKMYGPKGVSVLYVAHGTPYAGLCGTPHSDPGDDGSEGTPAVGSVVGFAEALALCEESRAGDVARIRALREYFFKRLTERFPDVRIHGSTTERVANNVNVSFPNIEGEFLVSQLSHNGVYASAKSACLSGGTEGSYVIAALDPERTNNAVRFSLGRETTQDDIDLCISVLVDLVA
jgi:cysteine desulfurase